jgi:hypothetical protein
MIIFFSRLLKETNQRTILREELRDQHAIGEEIGEAITQSIGNTGYDETELEEELENLQQEALDDKLMQTGHVPKDRVDALPSAPQGGMLFFLKFLGVYLLIQMIQSKAKLHYRSKTTRKRSYGSCRPRWQCDVMFSLALMKTNAYLGFCFSCSFLSLSLQVYTAWKKAALLQCIMYGVLIPAFLDITHLISLRFSFLSGVFFWHSSTVGLARPCESAISEFNGHQL